MEYIKLLNGVEMPTLGYGVFLSLTSLTPR